MTKSVLACTLILFLTAGASFAAVKPGPVSNGKAADIWIPVGQTGKYINLQELSTIKVADFQQLTGKKMGLMQRISFKLAQRQLRHSIHPDGTIDNQEPKGLHFGGFALGFFLFCYGVLIAYLIHDKHYHRRVVSAWIGFAVACVLAGLLIVAMVTKGGRN